MRTALLVVLLGLTFDCTFREKITVRRPDRADGLQDRETLPTQPAPPEPSGFPRGGFLVAAQGACRRATADAAPGPTPPAAPVPPRPAPTPRPPPGCATPGSP